MYNGISYWADFQYDQGVNFTLIGYGIGVTGGSPSITLGSTCGEPGSSVQVEITGAYTNFSPGVTMANFGAGISVGGGPEGGFGAVMVHSPTSATANITIDPNAVTDTQTIILQTGSQQAQANFTIVVFDATSTQVIGIDGGTVSVQNHLGDTFTVTIPPLASDEDTSISVSALPNALPSAMAQNVYPGVVLGPPGLHFSLPIKIDVSPHYPPKNPNAAILHWLIDSQHILPIANQSTTQNGFEGELYHFSPPIFLGDMSCADIQADEEWISVDEPIHTPCELGDAYDGMMSLAQAAKQTGCTQEYNFVVQHAKSLIEVQTPELLAEPLPRDPCGANTNCVLRWADLVSSVLNNASEAQDIKSNKACKLSVSPQYLFLEVGETWQQGITATLLDPNGNEESCGIINWYSSNLNVVDIAASGMVSVPTGVGSGVANVSANCDGQLASTKVSVCSLSGTWQGTYAAQTIACAERDSDGCCIKWGGPDCIQRIMLAVSWPESVAETKEVLFIDLVQNPHRSLLNYFVLKHGHANRTLPSVRLRYPDPF